MKYIFEGQRNSIIKIPELQREINFYKDLMAFCKVFRVIYREKPDIVHSHMAKAGAIARCAVWLYNFVVGKDVKTVHTFHGHVLDGYFGETTSRFFLLVERLIAKFTDVIIAISATQKWELSEKLQIANPEKIRIINLGFDLEPFFDAHHFKGSLRDKLGVDSRTILISIIGRLVPIKNHLMFLRAAKYFIESNPGVSVKFLLVGDGELRKDLEHYGQKSGLQEHLIFYGWERNISMIYADIDILALTSLNEGTPVSIIEAMAAQVPVITTGVGGVKDLLGSYIGNDYAANGFQLCERGILCESHDPQHFANGLSYLLNNGLDKDDGRIMRAWEYVKQNYSQERLIEDIEALYIDLAGVK